MGLTLYWEQKLAAAGLVRFFDQNRAAWLIVARDALQYVKKRFPRDATIRHDDVAKIVVPVIEVDEGLKKYLDRNKLTQKYWPLHFADLVIDRTWNEITNQGTTA
jgi:hypothetical protein